MHGWVLAIVAGAAPSLFLLTFFYLRDRWQREPMHRVAMAFALVRRQALKDAEPFWSPPTRRVAQALSPPLFVGLMAGVFLGLPAGSSAIPVWWLPSIWMALYGCAVHAAGFVMPRGMKLFGWGFVLAGGGCFWRLSQLPDAPSLLLAHAVMGAAFGLLHLTYGIYLYFTEQRRATT